MYETITAERSAINGPAGRLHVPANDEAARKFCMLWEGECLGLGPTAAARKYGYSKQRYHQLRKALEEGGVAALTPKKRGPKTNYRRSVAVERQIIRYCFLDQKASPEVIAQKLRQQGRTISTRTVERVIAAYGLQKKTLLLSADRHATSD